MAVGMDRSLPKQGRQVLGAPGRPPAPQQGAAPSYASRPPAIADRAVQDVTNNMLASSYGAGQMARKEGDRAGISRGKASQYYADIAQTAADAKAQGAAAGAEMEAASANAQARMAYDNTMKAERSANDGLLEGLRSNAAQERLARRGWQQDLYEALSRGQLGLDSMNLDWTPLMDKFFRD
jgi:hypothetical protein